MGKAKSVICKDMEHCYICGFSYVDIHHIFYGTANRKLSDEYGYVVPLCRRHHTGDEGVHFNKLLDTNLKGLAQEHFERIHGTRKCFIEVFGKSYL